MLRKERKWNHIKCSIKTNKGEKKWKTKTVTKNMGNKWKTVTDMVDINPTISVITLNVNGLNVPIKRNCQST